MSQSLLFWQPNEESALQRVESSYIVRAEVKRSLHCSSSGEEQLNLSRIPVATCLCNVH